MQDFLFDYVNFLVNKLENKAASQENSAGLMIDAYLFGHVLEYLRPDWFRSEKHHPAFLDLLAKISKYRQKVDRDSIYNGIAQKSGLFPPQRGKTVFGDPQGNHVEFFQGLVNPTDLGLLFSADPKDYKFTCRAITQYLHRAFPQPTTSSMVINRSVPTRIGKQLDPSLLDLVGPLNRASRRALINGKLPFPPPGNLSQIQMGNAEETAEGTISLGHSEKADFIYEMVRYVIILAGDIEPFSFLPNNEKWFCLELDDGSWEVDPSSLWARKAACLRPTADACAFCQPQFRRLLSTIYYVRESGLPTQPLSLKEGEEKAGYFKMGDAVIMPFVKELLEEGIAQREVIGTTLNENQDLEKKVSDAEQEIKELRTKLAESAKQPSVSPEQMQELIQLRKKTAKAAQAAKVQEATLERMKEEAANLKQERDRLLRALAESQTQFNSLNEQLLDLIEEKFNFVDDEIPEVPAAPAGIRAKIGEDIFQQLSAVRLAVVGGHDNTLASLRDLFPDWKFYPTNTMVPDGLTSVDAMAIIATYVSHKTYEQAKSAAKGIDLKIIPVMHNSPVSICRTLAAMLSKKEEIAS